MSLCIKCRRVNFPCPHDKQSTPINWRPPKKTNEKAWKRIEAGEILWDRRAIASKELKHSVKEFFSEVKRRKHASNLKKDREKFYRPATKEENNLMDDAAERWHTTEDLLIMHISLHEYWGMTWEEARWTGLNYVPKNWSADKIKTYTTYQEYLDENRRPN